MNNSCVENFIAKNLEIWIIFRILVGWVGGQINRENQQGEERLFGPCGARTKNNLKKVCERLVYMDFYSYVSTVIERQS